MTSSTQAPMSDANRPRVVRVAPAPVPPPRAPAVGEGDATATVVFTCDVSAKVHANGGSLRAPQNESHASIAAIAYTSAAATSCSRSTTR